MEAALRALSSPHSGQIYDLQTAAMAEARFATQDGYIWPLKRGDMVTSAAIRERLAEDLAGLVRDRGADAVILTDDYLRLGWNRDQVAIHGKAATRLYQEQRRGRSCGNDQSPRSRGVA